MKKRITIGILAHVDAGKTTLSEALLAVSGAIPKAGRVDKGESFLDTDQQEKTRGITIRSGEARFDAGDTEITLVDTPGHVDFSAEMERTLQILDLAVLVISGRELIQGHTLTIWRLLEHHQIPTFIFINKMDLQETNQKTAMRALRASLDDGCICFHGMEEPRYAGTADPDREPEEGRALLPNPEDVAMCDEQIMDRYLEGIMPGSEDIARAISRRRIFPCFFGSALRQEGIEPFLQGLDLYTRPVPAERDFAARVYRISRDGKGTRLTHMKLTGGRIRVKDSIRTDGGFCPGNGALPSDEGQGREGSPEPDALEKIHQIRLCSGDRYESVDEAEAGQLVAVAGLEHTRAGQGLGLLQGQDTQALLQPVLLYSMVLEEGANVPRILQQMRQLQEEDPQLHVRWNEKQQQIQVRLMGEIQLEILQQLIEDRFGFRPSFDEGQIEYRETIDHPVRGAGHFEPLRHYAEVHLLLEPLPQGSGLVFSSSCSSDALDTNWQRLIMTHLSEREHPGALVGAPVTDLRITIEGGRAHLKHTEGGDFRQATCRAVRQALRKARAEGTAVLLEPWYAFRLELPADQAGRAMADIQRMGGSFAMEQAPADRPPAPGPAMDAGGAGSGMGVPEVTLTGRAPVSRMRGYAAQVASYTRGYGHFSCSFSGYAPCHNAEEVMAASDYDPDADLENPADSIFCSHGAGRIIPWDEADDMMHVQIGRFPTDHGENAPGREQDWEHDRGEGVFGGADGRPGGTSGAPGEGGGAFREAAGIGGRGEGRDPAEEKELDRIFKRSLSRNKKDKVRTKKAAHTLEAPSKARTGTKPAEVLPEYLLVDGYNIIFAWEELRELSKVSIDAAREALIDILSNYRGYRQCQVILVFDAYRVKGGTEHTEKQGGITVVFTAEAETADTYIERASYAMRKKYRVRVATSDRLEQMIILGNDAFRVSATEFQAEVYEVNERIRDLLEEHQRLARQEGRQGIRLPLRED